MSRRTRPLLSLVVHLLCATICGLASDWPNWRGPSHNGVSSETDLVTSWSLQENLLWSVDFVGRSTPVVWDGRACAMGRVGEGTSRQELVACLDAFTGRKLWEYRLNVYHTTVPWNRVGWANPVVDPETGYIYVQGVGGTFLCLDEVGGLVWKRSLGEDFGFLSGYGGRTQTPVIDEERLYVTFSSAGWGKLAPPRHRTFAFDKQTGNPLWVSTPGRMPADLNSQSTPVVAVIQDQRLLIQGNGDGWIYALKARTGEKVWEFHLSKRAINTSVVVQGNSVYAAHSEENIDEGSMGRVVAFDARGTGDITGVNERWRADLAVGFSSPVFHEGFLYVVDNSANLHALDAANGAVRWTHLLGTVGKGSPVWADGKLFVTEVNGRFHIIEAGAAGPRSLDVENLELKSGRYAEIYGSPAIAYGRIYFTTEGGFYCLGGPNAPSAKPPSKPVARVAESPASAGAAIIHSVPAEITIDLGQTDQTVQFSIRAFDAKGKALGSRKVTWSLEGLQGSIKDGLLSLASSQKTQVGKIVAHHGDLKSEARVRVFSSLPQSEDFEQTKVGSRPAHFLKSLARFHVEEIDGNRLLVKDRSPRGIHRHVTFLGPSNWTGYTIQTDLMGDKTRRRLPDMGLVNCGYTMDLMGVHQQIQVLSWAAELRMRKTVPFSWEPNVWYQMKMRVDVDEQKAWIRGKVWRREEPEPDDWTITVEDELPIREGSPGLYGYSPTNIYYDNIIISKND